MILTAHEIAQATGGALIREAAAGPVLTDTRALTPGSWFVALQGPRFDGHDYLQAARRAGAIGAVVARDVEGFDGGLVKVADTTQAFADLGRAARRKLDCPVVGLTGTSGKTTTRALIALALSPLGLVHQTVANLNNHLGVPMTLLAAPPDPAAVVVEMGTSGPGEIAKLAKTAEPSHRLILNIGHGHLEELGDIEGVGREKRALFDTARPGDTVFLNLDDPRLSNPSLPRGVSVITFGRSAGATVCLHDLKLSPQTLSTHGRVSTPHGIISFEIPAFGAPFALNATAAIAVAFALQVPLQAAADALSRYAPVGMRQRIETVPGGPLVLNDAYNANPDSVCAALTTLAAMPGQRVAILGDMLELGDLERALHQRVLEHAQAHGIDEIWVVGPRFAQVAQGWKAVRVAEVDEIVTALRGRLGPDHRVLVKGSRGMRLERIVQGLLAPAQENC
ncbi:MAG: UDP-N-acetylmuramoyl-tripeptide--D-alanyl-D-alanine ligase [Deltaproteobacteria bacterium]|nr:MAG: UDP-N-acetylmuramoyl-tripeptide--D-alanyl-D-alanine ligase [Deltaproteobacteria bacterium]